jgi:predicted ribosome quality control (RQC) complex YloA/Tae2 family protein
MKEAELEDYTAAAAGGEGGPGGAARTVKVALDPMLTPAQNAQRYFRRYSKAGTALKEKAKQLEIVGRDIDFLESYRVYLDNAADAADIDALREELRDLGYIRKRGRKPVARSPRKEYLRYESSTGSAIYVGRSGRENDELTMRKAAPTDLWLHTKDIPGSHVILKSSAGAGGRGGAGTSSPHAGGLSGFDEASVREAAGIAAWHSKARDSESVPVDYCLVKYVKKPSGAKPGMVIFTHNRTLYVKPRLPEAERA